MSKNNFLREKRFFRSEKRRGDEEEMMLALGLIHGNYRATVRTLISRYISGFIFSVLTALPPSKYLEARDGCSILSSCHSFLSGL